MTTPYTRPATQDDVFAMEQIMVDAFKATYAQFMPEQFVQEWEKENKAYKSVRIGLDRAGVAEVMGRVVGFVMYLDNSISQLWVTPEYMRQGVGRSLIEYVESQYRKRGYVTITMYCYKMNNAALEFCKKLRFRRASQFEANDIPGGPVTVYNMLKMVSKLKSKQE